MPPFHSGDRVTVISTGECGIVIHTWFNEDVGAVDCYVAFFGDKFPASNEPPQRAPCVLRYASTSLRRADTSTTS
jgi:DNA gyrase inhibitor GyrI